APAPGRCPGLARGPTVPRARHTRPAAPRGEAKAMLTRRRGLFLLCAVAFSLFTVFVQLTKLGPYWLEEHPEANYPGAAAVIEHYGVLWLEGTQVDVYHVAVMQGYAGNPWQYRVLAEYVVEGVLRLARAIPVPHNVAIALLALRVVQNVLIFLWA